MKLKRWDKYNSPEERLYAWIAKATHNLCGDARKRLDSEYRDHYALTVQAARTEGCSEEEAIHRAEASLGNPRRVNREAKKSYLTRSEFGQLNFLRNNNPDLVRINLVFGISCIFLIFVLLYVARDVKWFFFFSLLPAAISIRSIFLALSHHLPLQLAVRLDIFTLTLYVAFSPPLHFITQSLLGFFPHAGFDNPLTALNGAFSYLLFIIAVCQFILIICILYFGVKLLRKLKHNVLELS